MRRFARLSVLCGLVSAISMATVVPAFANPGRGGPPPPDATTTTTTTLPEETTTTTVPPPTTTTTLPPETTTTTVAPPPPPPPPPPTPTPPPPAPAPTVAAVPDPSAQVTFVCPGYFEIRLINSGDAEATFEFSLYMEATERTDEAVVSVAAGDEVLFEGFVALAGEEDSTGEISIVEIVTETPFAVAFEPIDCVENPEPVVLLSSDAEDSCPVLAAPYPIPLADRDLRPTEANVFSENPLLLIAALLAALASGLFVGGIRRRSSETPAETDYSEPLL